MQGFLAIFWSPKKTLRLLKYRCSKFASKQRKKARYCFHRYHDFRLRYLVTTCTNQPENAAICLLYTITRYYHGEIFEFGHDSLKNRSTHHTFQSHDNLRHMTLQSTVCFWYRRLLLAMMIIWWLLSLLLLMTTDSLF